MHVVLSSRKQQCADHATLRHVGLEPRSQKILALKSSVHFRADFQPIVEANPGRGRFISSSWSPALLESLLSGSSDGGNWSGPLLAIDKVSPESLPHHA